MANFKVPMPAIVAVGVITLFLGLFHQQRQAIGWNSDNTVTYALSQIPARHKYAFSTFLNPQLHGGGDILADEDHYLTGARMLIYQLLHDPATRTNTSIPFIVLVTPDVPENDRARLTRDGAIVAEVAPIDAGAAWITPLQDRWHDVMAKLHVWELTQFEKILLVDTDTVIVRPLDGVFEDPATETALNLGRPDLKKPDEGPQPPSYMLAANGGPNTWEHGYPAARDPELNAGFVVLQPSRDVFNHYLQVANLDGRFDSSAPEQNLWNYVHRRDGNMPWTQLNSDWTISFPIYNDYENGIASFHEKYWDCGRDPKLRDVLLQSRWKMEGFFNSWDQKH